MDSIPSRSGTFARNPSPAPRDTSNSFRGVPSGSVARSSPLITRGWSKRGVAVGIEGESRGSPLVKPYRGAETDRPRPDRHSWCAPATETEGVRPKAAAHDGATAHRWGDTTANSEAIAAGGGATDPMPEVSRLRELDRRPCRMARTVALSRRVGPPLRSGAVLGLQAYLKVAETARTMVSTEG